MKKIILIIIASIIAIILFIINAPVFSEKIRSVKIKVIDSVTKEPIKDALVYYELEVVGRGSIIGIEPVYTRKIKREYITDESGILKIPSYNVFLKIHQQLNFENIYINLDVIDEAMTKKSLFRKKPFKRKIDAFFAYFNISGLKHIELSFNPIKKYKGFAIGSSSITTLDSNELGGTERQKFNILWNTKGLKKESESFIVELERWESNSE